MKITEVGKLADRDWREFEAIDVAGATSAQIMDLWDQALQIQMNTPPNDRHFACTRLVERLVQPLQQALEAERKAQWEAQQAREKAEAAAREAEAQAIIEAQKHPMPVPTTYEPEPTFQPAATLAELQAENAALRALLDRIAAMIARGPGNVASL